MPADQQIDDTLKPEQPQGSWSPLTYVLKLWEQVGLLLDTYHEGNDLLKRAIGQDVEWLLDSLPKSHDDGHVRSREDSFICKGPMHWHSSTTIQCDKDLEDLSGLVSSIPPDHPANELLERIHSFWTSVNSLKQLERFASEPQPRLLRKPLADGSNLYDGSINPDKSRELRLEYLLRRFWIRHLHFPGIFAANKGRAESFAYLYGIGRLLLEIELYCCPTRAEEDHYFLWDADPDGSMANWIPESRTIVREVLEDVARLAYIKDTDTLRSRLNANSLWRHQNLSQEDQPGREEILRENVIGRPFKTFNKMIARYDERMEAHPFERLIMDLLGKENAFERALTVEHVEDKLVNKQITPLDEHYIMNQRFKTFDRGVPYEYTRPMRDMLFYIEEGKEVLQFEDYIYKMTSHIAFVNRQRYGFRLMRDWCGHRPWEVIVQPYDTARPENQWLIRGIQIFNSLLLGYRYIDDPFVPSHTRNRVCNMFGIVPIDGCGVWANSLSKNACTICSSRFTPGNSFNHTIMVLRCEDRHMFHLKCIFEYWDHPNKYLHSCPTCGQSPALQHEILDFKPDEGVFTDTNSPSFVFNLSDYKPPRSIYEEPPLNLPDITKHPFRPTFYDIPSRVPGEKNAYWERENALVKAVEEAPLTWRQGTTRQRLPPIDGLEPLWHVAGNIGARWKAINHTGVRPPRWYKPSTLYDASRFSHDEEVAVLRKARRRRDRNRRARVRAERRGVLAL